MLTEKLELIADNLNYPIPISSIEKRIISTQIFNRLHNILQNSTVYLTYPANRTTRFIHSIGCMHIAGQIFQHGINNAEQEHRDLFFKDINKEIEQMIGTPKFIDETRKYIRSGTEYDIVTAKIRNLNYDPVYLIAMPGGLSDPDKFAFAVVYQALRLYALMHDLGHPPLSHVTEQAFEEIYDSLESKKTNGNNNNQRETYFFNIYTSLKGSRAEHLHERLGVMLSDFLLDNIFDDFLCDREDDTIKKTNKFLLHVIVQFTKKILDEASKEKQADDKDKSWIYSALSNIISSDLDADRLDYVSRDSYSSGTQNSPLNYGRLLYSYQLYYKVNEKSQGIKIPVFLPSVRSISTIEEFYRLRFDLYKYVIFHHRVSKTDALIRKVVVELSKIYFKESESEEKNHDTLLPDNISGLWKVLEPKKMNYINDIIDDYIQWDDHWLFSVLRKHYYSLEAIKMEGKKSLSDDENVLRIQLEEILSNKKHYYSLFKRVDTFIPIDEAFLTSIPEDFNWSALKNKLLDIFKIVDENQIGPIEDRIMILENYTNKFREEKKKPGRSRKIEVERQTHGFFVSNILDLLQHVLFYKRKPLINDMLNKAVSKLKRKYNLIDATIIQREILAGVDNDLELLVEGKASHVIHIGRISRIADDLKRSASFFPPFFIYTYTQGTGNGLDIEQMRIDFGVALWEAFMQLIDVLLGGKVQ